MSGPYLLATMPAFSTTIGIAPTSLLHGFPNPIDIAQAPLSGGIDVPSLLLPPIDSFIDNANVTTVSTAIVPNPALVGRTMLSLLSDGQELALHDENVSPRLLGHFNSPNLPWHILPSPQSYGRKPLNITAAAATANGLWLAEYVSDTFGNSFDPPDMAAMSGVGSVTVNLAEVVQPIVNVMRERRLDSGVVFVGVEGMTKQVNINIHRNWFHGNRLTISLVLNSSLNSFEGTLDSSFRLGSHTITGLDTSLLLKIIKLLPQAITC